MTSLAVSPNLNLELRHIPIVNCACFFQIDLTTYHQDLKIGTHRPESCNSRTADKCQSLSKSTKLPEKAKHGVETGPLSELKTENLSSILSRQNSSKVVKFSEIAINSILDSVAVPAWAHVQIIIWNLTKANLHPCYSNCFLHFCRCKRTQIFADLNFASPVHPAAPEAWPWDSFSLGRNK